MTDNNDQDRTVEGLLSSDSNATAENLRIARSSGSQSIGSRGQPLEPGSILGRYEVISCIDNGGMGVVYRAKHTALGKTVALKVVSAVLQSEPRAMERFLREMQAIGRLDPHPNVLNAYDAGDEDGVQYIATELIEGIQLGSLIRRIGALSVSESCKIISQAAKALDHLRKHELVHRDIKPSNLMLTRDGVVKVVDMGLALLRDEQADQITNTGEAMGSIDYMAPEQWIDSHGVDWRSDVYSLGCTFYCLLAGQAPYSDHRKGSVSRMRAHLEDPFPDIRDVRGDVPDQAVQLLQSMVAKKPEQRPTDLVKLSEQLDVTAAGDLIGLVERGFSDSTEKRFTLTPRSRVHGRSSGRSASFDFDAATQPEGIDVDTSQIKLNHPKRWPVAIGGIFLATVLVGFLAWTQVWDHGGDGVARQGLMAIVSEAPSDSIGGDSSDLNSADVSQGRNGEALQRPVQTIDLVGHHARIQGVVFISSQPARVASVDDDGVLCIFDLSEPTEPIVVTGNTSRSVVSIDHDPKTDLLYLVTGNGTLEIRSAQDGALVREETPIVGGFTTVARLPGQDAVVTGDWHGDVRMLDLSSETVSNQVIGTHAEVVYEVDVSSDGALIAWVGRDPLVTLFDVAKQKATQLKGHAGWVYDVSLSKDGKQMVSVCDDGGVLLWSLPGGELQREGSYTVPQSVQFFPDSRHFVIGGRGGVAQVWDSDSMQMVQNVPIGKSIDSLAVSPDGTKIVAGTNGGTLKAWSFAAQ